MCKLRLSYNALPSHNEALYRIPRARAHVSNASNGRAATQTPRHEKSKKKKGCTEDIFQRTRALRMSCRAPVQPHPPFSAILLVFLPSLCTLSKFFGAIAQPLSLTFLFFFLPSTFNIANVYNCQANGSFFLACPLFYFKSIYFSRARFCL